MALHGDFPVLDLVAGAVGDPAFAVIHRCFLHAQSVPREGFSSYSPQVSKAQYQGLVLSYSNVLSHLIDPFLLFRGPPKLTLCSSIPPVGEPFLDHDGKSLPIIAPPGVSSEDEKKSAGK